VRTDGRYDTAAGFTSTTGSDCDGNRKREDGGEGAEEHPYGYADDPYTRTLASADDSMDERDVEAMLLAKQEHADRSMQYEDDEQYH
jgi:hypothetical protein